MTKVSGAPVDGRGNDLKRRPSWKRSRRARMKRRVLLAVFKVVGAIYSVFRMMRWLFEAL